MSTNLLKEYIDEKDILQLALHLKTSPDLEQIVSDDEDDKRRPLSYAVALSEITIVDMLLQAGASTETRDVWGLTALHVACRENDNVDFIKTLLQYGADIEALSNAEWTPLFYACVEGNMESVELLLNLGAKTEWQDVHIATPLYLACAKGNTELVRMLLAHGSDVDARSDNGQTALHKVASSGDVVLAQMLIQAGADMNLSDDYGWTALHHACRFDQKQCAMFLINQGINLDVVNFKGKTGLQMCQNPETTVELEDYAGGVHYARRSQFSI